MIVWSATALARIGMTVTEADNLLALSRTDDEFLDKEHARQAWESHQPPTTYSVPGSPVIYLSEPVDLHIERYAERARAMGY